MLVNMKVDIMPYQLELSDLEQYIEDRVNELSAEKKS